MIQTQVNSHESRVLVFSAVTATFLLFLFGTGGVPEVEKVGKQGRSGAYDLVDRTTLSPYFIPGSSLHFVYLFKNNYRNSGNFHW